MWLKFFYQKLSNWFNYYYSFTSVYQQPQKKVIRPGYFVEFTKPEVEFLQICAASFNYEVNYARGYWQKEVALIPLRTVTFLGNSGAVVKHQRVVTESVFDQLRLTKSPAFRSPAWLWPQSKAGRFTAIMHLPWAATSNYHWFLDCLPRLYALVQTLQEPLILIVPAKMPPFQQETLSFLIRNQALLTLQVIGKHQKWQVAEFLLPTFISNHYSGFLPPEVLTFIREGVWQGYGVEASAGKTRLYISRGKAAKRRLLDEEALLQVLAQFNFKVVYAEDLTYAQQVQLFYNAEVVVGAHGAGLTNILFSRQVTVVELHPQQMVRSHYFMICKALGFKYAYLLGTAADARQDFRINPASLNQLLTNLLTGTQPDNA